MNSDRRPRRQIWAQHDNRKLLGQDCADRFHASLNGGNLLSGGATQCLTYWSVDTVAPDHVAGPTRHIDADGPAVATEASPDMRSPKRLAVCLLRRWKTTGWPVGSPCLLDCWSVYQNTPAASHGVGVPLGIGVVPDRVRSASVSVERPWEHVFLESVSGRDLRSSNGCTIGVARGDRRARRLCKSWLEAAPNPTAFSAATAQSRSPAITVARSSWASKGLYDKSCRLHHIPNATSAEAAGKFPPTGSQAMAAEVVLTGGSADMVALIGSFARSC